MTYMKELIEEHITSSAHLAKKHIHPKLMRMMEIGGMATVFRRGEGQYLYDLDGNRFLDLLSGGGIHFVGRNHPRVMEAIADVASMGDQPNICVVNASILGGLVAERLIGLAGEHFGKAVFANSGSEATDVALRFARYVTRRRRFLYLDGAFHGRTWGAISVNGWAAMKDGMDPMLPVCTPIPPNDLGALRRELSRGDVAGFIFEPVQGMTLTSLDPGYLAEAQALCRKHDTMLIADEIQTGFGRCGAWFLSREWGIEPDLLTVSKTLSGGHVPVSAAVVSEEVYHRVYDKFTSGPFYYSTFAENNLAMAASLATMDVLEEADAPKRARELSARFRSRLLDLADKHDVIERIGGTGLMIGIFFQKSEQLALKIQQSVMQSADPASFGAAVNVDMYTKRRVMVQVPGPTLSAIKILPPICCTDEDVDYFADALDQTLSSFYRTGPVVGIGRAAVKDTLKNVREAIPGLGTRQKKKPLLQHEGLIELEHYTGDVREDCDFLVVGSGPGGALVARHLAATGKKTILVEVGPVARTKDFRPEAGWTMARYFFNGGLRMTRGNIFMPTLQARVLGGGSVINSAICLRATESSLKRWEHDNGLDGLSDGGLDRWYDAAERFMSVRPTPAEVQGPRNDLFRLGAQRMGWHAEPIARNEDGCQGSGQCFTGCPNDGKLSTDRRGVPEVLDAGGVVYTSMSAERIIIRNGRVVGITGFVLEPLTERRLHKATITAKCTVLAAGCLASPVIIRKSGLKRKAIGDNLRFHPGSAIMAVFDEPVAPWAGASQGYHVLEHLEQGIKLETLWATPELMAFRFPGLGTSLKEHIANYRNIAVWDTWVSGQDSVGRVRGVPTRADVWYHIGDGDVRRVKEATAKLIEMAFAAGATGVITGVHTMPEVFHDVSAANHFRRFDGGIDCFPVASNHVFGGMCMGADPELHATDANGAVYGVDDLYVCDTGLFPDSAGVNPMLTIMALAERMGDHLVAKY